MNTKDNYNSIVRVFAAFVDTLARSLVVLFDGLRDAVTHANPSLFGLVATLLPFALPLPVAFMTARSAQQFFEWDTWAANVLGFGLEGLGLLAWVRLVDGIIESDQTDIANSLAFLWGVALSYEALLILINVVLAWNDGATGTFALVLLLVCLLPALSAAMYGIHRRETQAQLAAEREEEKQLKERIRQERRADRLAAKGLQMTYAADTAGVEEAARSNGGKFRRGRK
jgi:hypothetical protein